MPKRRPTIQVDSNEWVTISWTGQHEQCCACGLTHVVDFRVDNGRLQFRARQLGEKKT